MVPKYYKLATGDVMRDYQLRAAHKVFTGTQVINKVTGCTISGLTDGTPVHIDMGLGKTIIALTAIVWWYQFGVIKRPVLVIAPIKVCETVWRQEAEQWSHTRHLTFSLLRGNEKQRAFALARKAHVYLVNPELLKWLFEYLRKDWSFFDAVIIDDVSLKNPRSVQFKTLSNYGSRFAMKGMDGKALTDGNGHFIRQPPYRFKRSAKLTGTPSTAGLHHLWAPMYLMDHGSRLHSDYDTFLGRYFHKGQEVADHVFKYEINKEEADVRPAVEARNGAPERIHEIMADCTVELNAEDYGVLPQVIGDASKGIVPPSHLHYVELPDELRVEYDRLEKEAIMELEKDTIMAQNGGAKSMMCWQLANGALYTSDDFGQKQAKEVHTRKLDKLVELIDVLDTNLIIPYYFQHDFARITARLNKEGMAFTSLKGRNTERIIDRWNGGYTPILLLHPQSAAHGLNLQFGGHTFIWFTLLWSLERYLQTLARLARSGQKGIVANHHIATARTTDDLMLANLRQNGNDQSRFRAALREYQALRGLGLSELNPLAGLGL
jgi:hypothetical protein